MDRVDLKELTSEIQIIAGSISNGIPVDDNAGLKRELEYYRQIEQRLAGVPLHRVVDSYLASNPSQKMIPAKVSDVVTGYLATIVPSGLSTAWHRVQTSYLKYLTTAYGDREIHTVLTADLSKLLTGVAGGIRNRKNVRAALVTLFAWARDEMKALPINQRTEAELLGFINVKRKRALIYTPTDMESLMTVKVGKTKKELGQIRRVRDVWCLVGFCGLRVSEVTGEDTDHDPLTIESILFDFDQIRVGEQKVQTKGDRFAPLLPTAKKRLRHLKGKTGFVWEGTRFDYYEHKIFEAAGVTKLRNGWRKSFITYRMAIIKNANQVAEEAGNSPSEITKSYKRPELIHVAEAWFKS